MSDKLKPDSIVKSIFERDSKKEGISSIFNFKKGINFESENAVSSVKNKALLSKGEIAGIDLGTSAIKIVKLKVEDGKPVIAGFVLEELPVEVTKDKKEYFRVIPEVLRNLVDKNNLKGLEAFSSVSLNSAKVKNISLPNMPRDEINSALKWELQHSGVDISNSSYDYIVLNENKVNVLDKIEVLAIFSNKNVIMNHLSLLESASLNVSSVEIEPLSLLACCDYNNFINAGEVAVVLDVGGMATNMSIVVNNELRFSRSLMINGYSLTNSIIESCGVNYNDAERIKKGFNPDVLDDLADMKSQSYLVKNALLTSLETLASSIQHTFKYFSFQLTKSQITSFDKIILCGGSANLKIASSFFQNRLDTHVEILNPVEKIRVEEQAMQRLDNFNKDVGRFGVAVGLSLRGLE